MRGGEGVLLGDGVNGAEDDGLITESKFVFLFVIETYQSLRSYCYTWRAIYNKSILIRRWRGRNFLAAHPTAYCIFLCTFKADEPRKCVCLPLGNGGGVLVSLVVISERGTPG